MVKINLSEIKEKTHVGFGTSGIRNIATLLTDKVAYCYTKSFLDYLKSINELPSHKIALAGDLRESTPRLMKAAAKAIADCGLEVINCGFVPTPTVMLYGMSINSPSIMITGSHIPADRNGIKFNLAQKEVLKEDETAITNMTIEYDDTIFNEGGYIINEVKLPEINKEAEELYIQRYLNFYDKKYFEGRKIGLYGHSMVGRDIYYKILTKLGAQVIKIEYSDFFIPVDTEAVTPDLIRNGQKWIKEYDVETIITSDGDSDRPLLTDEDGNWFRADTTGILTAKYLNVHTTVMPVSCSTAAELSRQFDTISRVKIGSPYVISEMIKLKNQGHNDVIGYEGNGGFITITDFKVEGQTLKPLPTRDALIVLLSILALSKKEGHTLKNLRDELPRRYTGSSSLKGFPTDKALELDKRLLEDKKSEIENIFGEIYSVNTLDGDRFYLKNGDIIHFRPSKNSPEFRYYVESSSEEQLKILSSKCMDLFKKWSEMLKNYGNV